MAGGRGSGLHGRDSELDSAYGPGPLFYSIIITSLRFRLVWPGYLRTLCNKLYQARRRNNIDKDDYFTQEHYLPMVVWTLD